MYRLLELCKYQGTEDGNGNSPRQAGLLGDVGRIGRDQEYSGNTQGDRPVDLVDLAVLERMRLGHHQAFDQFRVVSI